MDHPTDNLFGLLACQSYYHHILSYWPLTICSITHSVRRYIHNYLFLATYGCYHDYFQNDEGVKLDEENSTIHLSQLFNWYEQDFGGSREAVLDWIAGYLDTGKLATMKSIRDKVDFKVKYLVYDWGNNEKKE